MSTSSIHYESYAGLVKQFGKNTIESRYELLASAYQKFLSEQNPINSVKLNGIILGYAIMDYFADIARIKEFHYIKLVNEINICAYESFWLLRRKPLQV